MRESDRGREGEEQGVKEAVGQERKEVEGEGGSLEEGPARPRGTGQEEHEKEGEEREERSKQDQEEHEKEGKEREERSKQDQEEPEEGREE